MKLVKFYVRTNDKDTLVKESPDSDFIELFNLIFDEYTLQEATGQYRMQLTNKRITEKTFIISVAMFNAITIEDLKSITTTLKSNLNQESIMVELDNEVFFE